MKGVFDRESETRQRGFKAFLWWWLESDNNPRRWIVDIILYLIIFYSVTVISLEIFHANIPPILTLINNYLLYFFLLEYTIRFYIGTDFIWDIKNEGLIRAIGNKIRWIFEFYHIIDLVALLYIVRFFRIFRVLRFLRYARILRAFRVFKYVNAIVTMIQGMRSGFRSLLILIVATLGIFTILSFGLFTVETRIHTKDLSSFGESFWFTIKLLGFGNDTPQTIIGKLIVVLMLISNILFFSLLISLVTTKMGAIMEDIKAGKIGKIRQNNHIVLCGYTESTEIAIRELLKDKRNYNSIILVTTKEDIDLDGVIYKQGDFSQTAVLKEVNIDNAKMAIVFAEPRNKYENKRTVDLRTAMTVFNIEKINSKIHTISEIDFEENAEILKNKISGDEIIYKGTIDANIIVAAVRHPYITPLIYEFLNLEGRKIEEIKARDIGFEEETKFIEFYKFGIEHDISFIGFINQNNKSFLAPDNNIRVVPDDRLIYLAEHPINFNKIKNI